MQEKEFREEIMPGWMKQTPETPSFTSFMMERARDIGLSQLKADCSLHQSSPVKVQRAPVLKCNVREN